MTDADTTTSAGNRRGRYALSAVILVLTIIGVTAVIRGTQNQPHQPPLAAVAAPPDAAPATGNDSNAALTTGPLMETQPRPGSSFLHSTSTCH